MKKHIRKNTKAKYKYITYKPIRLGKKLLAPDCGSLIIFEGRVRADKVGNATVQKIIYEAYSNMAEEEIEKIEREAIEKFEVKKVIIKHKIGEVSSGETSLLVAVLSQHRKEGFSAIQYIIDEIKERVPIWKKEILSDGKTRWVEEKHY